MRNKNDPKSKKYNILKAYYIKKIDNEPPFIHNLLRLSEKANLELSEDQKDFLDTLSTFNIRTRYDDYKMEFHKTCSQEFTDSWIQKIIGFRKWIKKLL